ncbi:MAG: reprolysin-like metallopeptidase [Ignavibacteria bacterium]
MKKIQTLLFFSFLFIALTTTVSYNVFLNAMEVIASSNSSVWTDISENNFILKGERQIIPDRYRIVVGNFNQIQSLISPAPMESQGMINNSEFIFELPLPYGGLSKFYVTEYSMLEPGLKAKFSDIKTYSIKGIDDPYAAGKLDITMHGFHAIVLSPRGDYFIDPYSSDERDIYISYYKKDFSSDKIFKCDFDPEVNIHDSATAYINNRGSLVCGPELRSYRLACAATGEYTLFHGGTIAAGQAAIVTCINRMNSVYEKDFAVRMVLVANNDTLVYTNASTDPYSNNNGGAMLGQNQSNLDNVIGTANYDFGHVFSTGGGGVAYLGVICVDGLKAQGVTGLGSPIGDPFYIDYVAHEMGHQFGGNHTFNSTVSSCGGGNINSSTAFEPGSGSTIMSYAGICGTSNLQNNSDAYFHSGSFTEMESFVQFGSGSTCPQIINTGNTPPTIIVPVSGFTIPYRTPFQLTGSATDIENPNSLTYCWEEMDLGPSGVPNNPTGNAPIFRSFKPDTTSTRLFPKILNILNNSQTIGEILPTYARDLSFRLTVRDNNPAGGGVNNEYMDFHVTDSAGPFKITQPDTILIWNSNIPQMVTWNVANTNVAPVNCQFVNIKLSTNGGFNFSSTLISNTPNDGSQLVTLPSLYSEQARIKIEAADNVFFDISSYNFTLSNLISITTLSSVVPEKYMLEQNYPNPFNPVTNFEFGISKTGFVSLKIFDMLGKEVSTLFNSNLNPGLYKYDFDASGLTSGIYFYTLKVNEFIETKKMILSK